MSDAFCVDIQGDSMWPTICDGERLEFLPHDTENVPAKGSVVLAEHPLKQGVLMVKRVKSVSAGRVFLEGDNPDPLASEDSHNFGTVPFCNIVGVWVGR